MGIGNSMRIKVGVRDWPLQPIPNRSLAEIHFIYNFNYPGCKVNKRRVRRIKALKRKGLIG